MARNLMNLYSSTARLEALWHGGRKIEMRHLITTFVITFLSAPALALTPYTAVYEAKGSGLSASNQIILLPPDASGRIELRSVSKARGVSGLLKRDPIV